MNNSNYCTHLFGREGRIAEQNLKARLQDVQNGHKGEDNFTDERVRLLTKENISLKQLNASLTEDNNNNKSSKHPVPPQEQESAQTGSKDETASLENQRLYDELCKKLAITDATLASDGTMASSSADQPEVLTVQELLERVDKLKQMCTFFVAQVSESQKQIATAAEQVKDQQSRFYKLQAAAEFLLDDLRKHGHHSIPVDEDQDKDGFAYDTIVEAICTAKKALESSDKPRAGSPQISETNMETLQGTQLSLKDAGKERYALKKTVHDMQGKLDASSQGKNQKLDAGEVHSGASSGAAPSQEEVGSSMRVTNDQTIIDNQSLYDRLFKLLEEKMPHIWPEYIAHPEPMTVDEHMERVEYVCSRAKNARFLEETWTELLDISDFKGLLDEVRGLERKPLQQRLDQGPVDFAIKAIGEAVIMAKNALMQLRNKGDTLENSIHKHKDLLDKVNKELKSEKQGRVDDVEEMAKKEDKLRLEIKELRKVRPATISITAGIQTASTGTTPVPTQRNMATQTDLTQEDIDRLVAKLSNFHISPRGSRSLPPASRGRPPVQSVQTPVSDRGVGGGGMGDSQWADTSPDRGRPSRR